MFYGEETIKETIMAKLIIDIFDIIQDLKLDKEKYTLVSDETKHLICQALDEKEHSKNSHYLNGMPLMNLMRRYPDCKLYMRGVDYGVAVWRAVYVEDGDERETFYDYHGYIHHGYRPKLRVKKQRPDTVYGIMHEIEKDKSNVRLSSDFVNALKTKFKDKPLGEFLSKHGCKVWMCQGTTEPTYRVISKCQAAHYRPSMPAAYDMTFSITGELISGNEQEIIDGLDRYYDKPKHKSHFDSGTKKVFKREQNQHKAINQNQR